MSDSAADGSWKLADDTYYWHSDSKFPRPIRYTKDDLVLHQLTNPIDRLFRHGAIFLEGQILPYAKYDLLKPSLRLATHMIYSSLLHNFWSTIFLTQPTYWQDRKDELLCGLQFAYESFDPDREPSHQEIEDITTMIDRMNRHVSFDFTKRANGHCVTAQQGDADLEVDDIPRGYKSEIRIPPSFLTELKRPMPIQGMYQDYSRSGFTWL